MQNPTMFKRAETLVRRGVLDGQAANAYKNGDYISGNLLVTPAKNVMMGGEFQWARRQNFSDGFSVNDFRVEFQFKYSFSYKLRSRS
jgi:hypothetical protein